jgi:hypothetical protein
MQEPARFVTPWRMEQHATCLPQPADTWPHWRRLTLDEAPLAFPLVLAVDGPCWSLDLWCRAVRAWLEQGPGAPSERGMAGLLGTLDTLFSLFFFAVERGRPPLAYPGAGPRAAPWLLVTALRVIEPARPQTVLRATLRAADQLALCHRCGLILIEPAATQGLAEIEPGLLGLADRLPPATASERWLRRVAGPAVTPLAF